MSLASKSKNIPIKPSGIGNGYNPNLVKFQTVDSSAPPSVSPLRSNGHFGITDETNDMYERIRSGKEYDLVSNNSSGSADSEDHKEKPPQHIPSLQVDIEKREKIRLKNEKKHQRQKERRAQELHDRCTGFVMSRKLEELSQQIVAMGFSSERAKLALTINKGKVEESVDWLIEVGEGADKHKEQKPQVDISVELARIAEMEIRYKCSKQEIERAVVSCEGDLYKAEVLLNANHGSSTAQMKSSISTSATRVPVELEKSQPRSLLVKESSNNQLGKKDHIVLMQRPKPNVPETRNVTFKRENSPAISVASLGLYSGLGSTSGLSSPVDWNNVGMLLSQLVDYTHVDWTLNRSPPRSNQGIAASMHRYEPFPSAVIARNGDYREWSSPFEERDMFTLPRQFVSPSL